MALNDIVRKTTSSARTGLGVLAAAGMLSLSPALAHGHSHLPRGIDPLDRGETIEYLHRGATAYIVGGGNSVVFDHPDVYERFVVPEHLGIVFVESYDNERPNISQDGWANALIYVPADVESIRLDQGDDSGPRISAYGGHDSLPATHVFEDLHGRLLGFLAYLSAEPGGTSQNEIEAIYR